MFSGLKISTKLAAGFAALTLLMAAISGFAIYQLKAVNQGCYEIGTNWMPSIGCITELDADCVNYRMFTLEHISTTDPEQYKKIEQQMEERAKDADKKRAGYVVASDREKTLVAELDSNWATYRQHTATMLQLSRDGKKKEAKALYDGESLKAFTRWDECPISCRN